MRKGKWYLLAFVLFITETLFILQVMRVGNADIWGSLTKGILAITFLFLVYKGMRWAKWLVMTYFILMALACTFAGIENSNWLFYVLVVSYAFLTHQIFSVQFSAEQIPDERLVRPLDVRENISNEYTYPSLVKRYKALFIDAMLLFAIMIGVMILVDENQNRQVIMISLFVILGLFYEPLLTVYSTTIGQRLMGIRVRSIDDQTKRINLFQAYVRILVKASLGWLSFLTIHANPERRAIHDLAGGSVVIEI